MALTGLRYGEASALRWSDVREDEGLIRVLRGQWKGHVSTTKTGVVRSVPLVAELAVALREHRAQLVAKQHPGLAEGWVFRTTEVVFFERTTCVCRWSVW